MRALPTSCACGKGTNEKGSRLTQFEFGALVERWVAAFGCLPPEDAKCDVNPVTPIAHATEPVPEPDTKLSPKEVVRLTGISLATIKRMVIDGRFPPPYRPSPRRICWPAREVYALLEQIGGARYLNGRDALDRRTGRSGP
jgi:predicted DNA-binding transcriptional regulator AlpA